MSHTKKNSLKTYTYGGGAGVEGERPNCQLSASIEWLMEGGKKEQRYVRTLSQEVIF
jgi:hypothetical protein